MAHTVPVSITNEQHHLVVNRVEADDNVVVISLWPLGSRDERDTIGLTPGEARKMAAALCASAAIVDGTVW